AAPNAPGAAATGPRAAPCPGCAVAFVLTSGLARWLLSIKLRGQDQTRRALRPGTGELAGRRRLWRRRGVVELAKQARHHEHGLLADVDGVVAEALQAPVHEDHEHHPPAH